MPLFGKGKIRVTRAEFSKVLFAWLLRNISEDHFRRIAQASIIGEAKKKTSLLFGLDLDKNKNVEKIFEELLILEMWAIAFNCMLKIVNKDISKECLATFHRLVYDELLERKETDFEPWVLSLAEQYEEYGKAITEEHEPGPLGNLSYLFYTKLYGNSIPDAFILFEISGYIKSSLDASLELIDKYEVKP